MISGNSNPIGGIKNSVNKNNLKAGTSIKNPLTKISPATLLPKKRQITGLPDYSNDKIPTDWFLYTINEDKLKTSKVGNFPNGRIPLNKMVKNEYLAKDMNGDSAYLIKSASEALNKLMKLYEEAKFDGKQEIFFTDGYRSRSRQIVLRKKDRKAARSGKSNHGWGISVDIHWGVPPSLNQDRFILPSAFKHPVYKWFFENAPNLGWYNPPKLRDYKDLEEWWHWEYRGAGKSVDPVPPEYQGNFTKQDMDLIIEGGGTFEGGEYLTATPTPPTPPQGPTGKIEPPTPGAKKSIAKILKDNKNKSVLSSAPLQKQNSPLKNSPSMEKAPIKSAPTPPDPKKFKNLNPSGPLPKLRPNATILR